MKTADKIRIEKALITIAEIINFETVKNYQDTNDALINRDYAKEHGDEITADKCLKRAKRLKLRAAELADIKDAIDNLDIVFHRTF